MKRINVEDYPVEDGLKYEVKRSIVTVLFHPELKLGAYDTLKANKVAEKVERAEGTVLLEDAEYELIKRGLDVTTSFSRNDVTFIKRILEAEDVSV